MTSRLSILPVVALSVWLAVDAGQASAQRPSSWQPAPAPAVPASSVNHRGKILWFVESGTLHVFSAATRSWASMAVSPTAAIRNTNDWLLVVDGPTITALSSAHGRFSVLPASPQATILNPATGRNDGILLAIDGSTLWSFTGFVGQWTSRTVAPTALISVQRNVALIADGTSLFAMSAVFGTWQATTMNGIVQAVGVGDTLGWATDGSDAYGFSAIRNTWATATLPSGAQPVPAAERDVAVWHGTTDLLGFSGVRGAFDQAVTGQPTSVDVSDHLAHAYSLDNRRHWLFSVPHARWTAFSTAQPAATQLAEATVLLIEPTQLHAYSALQSSVASLAMTSPVTAVNAAVAGALEPVTGDLRLFSAVTGVWYPVPATALRAMPQLARNGALLTDGAGTAWAFSARSGRFFSRTLGASPSLHVDSGSSLMATEDDRALAMFEPRRETWIDTPITAADRPLTVRIWRTTLVAFSPTEGIGFSSLHGAIERTTLPGTLLDPRASSEVGAAITAAGVVAYSAVSDLRTEAQFPEFRRMFGRGSRVDLEATGAPRSTVGAVAGFARAQSLPVAGLGELAIDPALLIPLAIGTLDVEGLATLHLPVPDQPALEGVELAFQGAVLPPSGTPYLTRLATFRIH